MHPADEPEQPISIPDVHADDQLLTELADLSGGDGTRLARLLAIWRDDLHRAIDGYFDTILAYLAIPPADETAPVMSAPAVAPEPIRLDAQSIAFRQNPVPVPDEQLGLLAERIHPPATSLAEILLPDDHEALHWDIGRTGPKTIDEARDALAERIADPTAPDDTTHAGAYDQLGGSGG